MPIIVPLIFRFSIAPSVEPRFCQTLPDSAGPAREQLASTEVLRGNIPAFLRTFSAAPTEAGGHRGTFFALADYLAVGTDDDDFVRIPLTAPFAQRIADALGCLLPTTRMVDCAWAAAAVKLRPQPIPPDARMQSTSRLVTHNCMIEEARAGAPLGALTAGHKKDVVVASALRAHPGRVAIYGWQHLHDLGVRDGVPIQPLNATSHSRTYVDYSHGIRLVASVMTMDGEEMAVPDVLRDRSLSALVSAEGPTTAIRYSTPAKP